MVATEKGFTLVEVLVAMVVFAVSLIGLESMQITTIQVNTIASRLMQGTTLAQDRLEQLMAMPYTDLLLADVTPPGTFTSRLDPTPPPGYTIRWDVDTNVPSVGIKTINIVVTWRNLKASAPKTFSLSVRKPNPNL